MLQNFLYISKDENSTLKVIDFGLSDYVKPGMAYCMSIFSLIFFTENKTTRANNQKFFADERLNDIVGSAYYVAPEVLHRSYGTEADMWSIGVIAYILLCGSRPFWARTESGIFRAVLKADPSFEEAPWPSLSADAKDFVKRLLNKDYRKRLTAAQALSMCSISHRWCMALTFAFYNPMNSHAHSLILCTGHPWLVNHCDDVKIPFDMIIHKLVKTYICSSSLRKSALGVRTIVWLFSIAYV